MNNFPRYDSYKDSGVEWLGEVPEHWKVRRIKFIFKEKNIRSTTGKEELLSLSKYHGVVPRSKITDKIESANSLINYKICSKGDLIINKLQAWNGMLDITKFDGLVSPDYSVYENSFGDINKSYFKYLFRTELCIREFAKSSRGIGDGFFRLYTNDFFDISSVCPPIKEQTAIAEFLDRKTAQVEQAIAQKERLIELLKERRQILIHKAVTRGLNPNVKLKHSGVDWIGEIPEHWEVKRLKFLSNLISEKILSKQSNLNYFGMENIESWTGKLVSSDSEVEGLANYFAQGDILFGKLRPYLAKVHLAEVEGICSTEFLVYRVLPETYNFYLHLLMLSFGFINLIDSSTYGSKMPRANSDFIGNQLIAIPPKSEQTAISQYIENVSAKIETAISCKQKEIEKLKEYKAVLINSAVTGEIKVEG